VADVIPLRPRRGADRRSGDALCRNGHHKWQIETAKRFDVKQGRLVTSYRCARCGRTRNEAR
jgi:hypothetical protein